MLRFTTTLAAATLLLASLASAGAVAVEVLGRVAEGVPAFAMECGINTFDRADFLAVLAIALIVTTVVVFPGAYVLERYVRRGLVARLAFAIIVSAALTAIALILHAKYAYKPRGAERVSFGVSQLLIISIPAFVTSLAMAVFVLPSNTSLERTRER